MAIFPLVRPLLYQLDAERAHNLTLLALRLAPWLGNGAGPELPVRVAGIDFPNPLGLAAGFDKDAKVHARAARLGFGFVEVGTLTPAPQRGNPRPRLFRLAEDRAVINRMGFNNRGQLSARRRLERPRGSDVVGVNLGVNKTSRDWLADYAAGVKRMAPVADYLAINVSSPNTPGLRDMQNSAVLDELLAAVVEARQEAGPPVFLKLSPDLDAGHIEAIARVAMARGAEGLIVANTTLSRPPLESRHRLEPGGLSGAPLRQLALDKLRDFRNATGGEIALIACGGVASGADAYARIRAGASLVQLYSALVFEGPGLVRRILAELARLLARDGFASVAEAVGAGER
ncbi:MAG: quinone-dependent dihydroorotate dehydrogenase [Sphingomonadaceae bacterium]